MTNFTGVSLSIYSQIIFESTRPSVLSYTIDDGPPINFTVGTPTSPNATLLIDFQLIIQTPILAQGLHSLRMTIVGPNAGADGNSFSPRMIIAQNTTRSSNLDPVPSLTSTGALIISQESRSSRHISQGALVAMVLSVGLVLLIGTFTLRFTQARRKRQKIADNSTIVQESFSLPDPDQRGRFYVAQYMTREKTEKYREALGNLTESQPVQDIEGGPTSVDSQATAARVRYRIHEDGGEVGEVEQVIDLPPIYSTLGQSPSIRGTSRKE